MYLPTVFQVDDPHEIAGIIADHPLGTLIAQHEGQLLANEVVFLVHQAGDRLVSLIGHVANGNEVVRLLRDGDPVLVVFKGVQGYISPSHYRSKSVDGKVVPTFDYEVVQVSGRIRLITGLEGKRQIVSQLTEIMERGLIQPWSVGDAPADYIDALLGAITGVVIDIEDVRGKAKMSQNRSATDLESLVEGQRQEHPALAQRIEHFTRRPVGPA